LENIKRQAELSLCVSIYHIVKGKAKNGRLKNLCKRLMKEAVRELSKMPELTKEDIKTMQKAIEKYQSLTGWGRIEKHILTYISGIADMLEGGEFQRIQEVLVDILDYFERDDNAPVACFWSGGLSAEKWNEAWRDL